MTISVERFAASLDAAAPPAGLVPPLEGLWWGMKGEWDRAHGIVQADDGREAAWVHAWLHRVEGDLDNAAYWYRRAARPAPAGDQDLRAEAEAIAGALLGGAG